jgi:GNAT superfamily N-acetyltransferase
MDCSIEYSLRINDFLPIAQKLYEQNVYMHYGKIQDWYLECTRGQEKILAISTAKINKTYEKYVGVCILLKEVDEEVDTDIGVYVLKDYRRQGIGTELVRLMKNVSNNYHPWTGSSEAALFYNKVS